MVQEACQEVDRYVVSESCLCCDSVTRLCASLLHVHLITLIPSPSASVFLFASPRLDHLRLPFTRLTVALLLRPTFPVQLSNSVLSPRRGSCDALSTVGRRHVTRGSHNRDAVNRLGFNLDWLTWHMFILSRRRRARPRELLLEWLQAQSVHYRCSTGFERAPTNKSTNYSWLQPIGLHAKQELSRGGVESGITIVDLKIHPGRLNQQRSLSFTPHD